MFPSPDLVQNSPILFVIESVLILVFYLAVIWVFARMGDNINKIRKMLEQEIKNRAKF